MNLLGIFFVEMNIILTFAAYFNSIRLGLGDSLQIIINPFTIVYVRHFGTE